MDNLVTVNFSNSLCDFKISINNPENNWDGNSRIHGMQENYKCVTFSVYEPPDDMEHCLLDGIFVLNMEEVAVEAQSDV